MQPQQQAPLPRERLSPAALRVEICIAQQSDRFSIAKLS
jgi:hypothetical protein